MSLSPIDFVRSFPRAQREELRAALKRMRRRVDENLSTVAAAHNATTTLASLICPAAEVDVGTVMHLQVAGTLTNTSGSPVAFTPLIALNGTTVYTDAVAVDDAGTDNTKAFLIDVRLTYTAESVVVAHGLIAVSADSTAADTGTGSLLVPQDAGPPITALAEQVAVVSPIYHTLSSQVRNRDQIVSVTLAIPNTATASASKRFAGLWAE